MKDKDKPAANKNTNDNAAIKKSADDKKSAPPASTPDNKSSKPTFSSRVLLVLLIFIAGMALSIYLMPTLSDRLPIVANWIESEQTSEVAPLVLRIDTQQMEIAALQRRTSELETALNNLSTQEGELIPSDIEERIVALETLASGNAPEQTESSVPASDSSQSTRIDLLLSRMSQLEASFVPLSKNMLDAGQAELEREQLASNTASLSEKLAELENRLSSVEQATARDNSGILLNLKITDLKRSFDRGNPYSAEIAAIEKIISDSSLAGNISATNALTALKQKSTTGIITIEDSWRRFNALIPAMLKEKGKDQNASWMQNTLKSIKNLITVRQTDISKPNTSDLDNLLAQIEIYLRQRNPQAAADTADALPERIGEVLTTWRAELQLLIDGSNAIVELENLATESYLLEETASDEQSETSL